LAGSESRARGSHRLRRERAQPDPERPPDLGAAWPTIHLDPTPSTGKPRWRRRCATAYRGGGAQLYFHVTAGNYDTDTLIEVLGELRQFLGGEKATLLWDGLPAHRSRAMRAWLATQRSWLVVERLPAYATELNPTEGL
jgi:hypothetical protein